MPGQFKRLDEVWAAEYVRDESEGKLFRRLFQPNRNRLLEGVKAIRQDNLMPDSPLGRPCLAVPHADMEALRRSVKWRELFSTDAATRMKAEARFLASPDSAPYRLTDKAS